MPALFDWLDNIFASDTNIMLTDDDEKSYNPFMINRGMSQHIDTILLADQANFMHRMPKAAQYAYLMKTTKKYKRRGSWAKKGEVQEHVDLICKVYQVNPDRAASMLELLSQEQIDALIETQSEGGVKGRGSKGKK